MSFASFLSSSNTGTALDLCIVAMPISFLSPEYTFVSCLAVLPTDFLSLSKKSFFAALDKMYFGGEEYRKELGERGRRHVLQNYNFENFNHRWVNLMDSIYEENGSWGSRTNYSSITFKEVA